MNLYKVRLTRRILDEPSKDAVAPIEATMSLDDGRGAPGILPREVTMKMPRAIFGGPLPSAVQRLEAKMYYVQHQSPAHALDMAQRRFGHNAHMVAVLKIGDCDGDGEPKIIASSDQDDPQVLPYAVVD